MLKNEETKKQIIYIKTDELIPYENNAKLHPDWHIEQVKASIEKFGFMSPLLIDEKNMVLAGHARLKAAKLLHIESLPCVQSLHLSKTEKKAYILADNKLTMNTAFDIEMLNNELKELVNLDFSIELLGFNKEDLEDLSDFSIDEFLSKETKKDKNNEESNIKTFICEHCGKESTIQ